MRPATLDAHHRSIIRHALASRPPKERTPSTNIKLPDKRTRADG